MRRAFHDGNRSRSCSRGQGKRRICLGRSQTADVVQGQCAVGAGGGRVVFLLGIARNPGGGLCAFPGARGGGFSLARGSRFEVRALPRRHERMNDRRQSGARRGEDAVLVSHPVLCCAVRCTQYPTGHPVPSHSHSYPIPSPSPHAPPRPPTRSQGRTQPAPIRRVDESNTRHHRNVAPVSLPKRPRHAHPTDRTRRGPKPRTHEPEFAPHPQLPSFPSPPRRASRAPPRHPHPTVIVTAPPMVPDHQRQRQKPGVTWP